MLVLALCFVVSLVSYTTATTEWWGDLRAHLNPPRQPAFYDVTYDDSDCPQGLRYDAIPSYVYFGTMISSLPVDDHDACVQRCLEKVKCKAVNFFSALSVSEQGFCELLSETQLDNPRLMRPFLKATYFENIRCRDVEEVEDLIVPKKPAPSVKKEFARLMKKISAKPTEFRARFRAARK